MAIEQSIKEQEEARRVFLQAVVRLDEADKALTEALTKRGFKRGEAGPVRRTCSDARDEAVEEMLSKWRAYQVALGRRAA